MSLLTEQMKDCTIIDKTTTADGYGGVKTSWVDGAPFTAAISFDTSMEARIGGAQSEISKYTVVTPRAIVLRYHDVFRREKDGKIFRVTSDGDDKETPQSASLDMRVVTAEEWSLPNG